MKKIYSWFYDNILFLSTIFILAFIPLYPKLPLLDIKNTWVYVRIEDFVILGVLLTWAILLIKQKVSLKTPLTIPIFTFWIVGAISTIHGIILIFPNTPNVFPNVAFLSYLRHIEYLSLFFVGYAGLKNKKFLLPLILTICGTLLAVCLYGLGQKYLSFPAFLTMNEEFAKGVPIHLSALSRLPSTFAGHYDLAAYLVLMVPIVASLIFGVKNYFIKASLFLLMMLSFIIMVLTVSRVSFFVLLISLLLIIFYQKKKIVLISIPFLLLFLVALLSYKSSLLQRFGNTVKEVDVMVNGHTGEAIGNVTYVPVKYFFDKQVKLQRVEDTEGLVKAIGGNLDEQATISAKIPPYLLLPPDTKVPLVKASNTSNGESLPQGTGYVNLALSPVVSREGNFFYGLSPDIVTTSSAQYVNFHGDFIVKKASAYDLSFTTRFQGEWPHAIEAFEKNIILGSGYGAVSLAVDNNYLRMLGEIGSLGTLAFLSVFLITLLYIKKSIPHIESKLAKSFIVGYAAGAVGLLLNAYLIDVFEASKIAYSLWILTGAVLGITHLYSSQKIEIYKELKNAFSSMLAMLVGLGVVTIGLFTPTLSNYFAGQDYTWFRQVILCSSVDSTSCMSFFSKALSILASMGESMYPPAAKFYFLIMYSAFWLNQDMYHLVSVVLHFMISVMFFFLAKRIFKDKLPAFFVALLFLIFSGYSQAIFWISSTGYLFSAFLSLVSLFMFILWEEKGNKIYPAVSFVAIGLGILFNQLALVVPVLLIIHNIIFKDESILLTIKRSSFVFILLLTFFGLIMYLPMTTPWLRGITVLFPLQILVNVIGYAILDIFGQILNQIYAILDRNTMFSVIGITGVLALFIIYFQFFFKKASKDEKRIILFGLGFFGTGLLPFIGIKGVFPTFAYFPAFGLLLILGLFTQKIYKLLVSQGKDIATGSVLVFALVFLLLHIIQIQEAQKDWHTAGQQIQNFFISIDDLYSNEWSSDDLELNFVNVPALNGSAPVFPDGLDDAVWFAFHNKKITINTYDTTQDAIQNVTVSRSNRIFEFKDDGMVKEIIPVKPTHQ